jgi:hypothetical protein
VEETHPSRLYLGEERVVSSTTADMVKEFRVKHDFTL